RRRIRAWIRLWRHSSWRRLLGRRLPRLEWRRLERFGLERTGLAWILPLSLPGLWVLGLWLRRLGLALVGMVRRPRLVRFLLRLRFVSRHLCGADVSVLRVRFSRQFWLLRAEQPNPTTGD